MKVCWNQGLLLYISTLMWTSGNMSPVLRPLRRMVSNFDLGRRAKVTLVYQIKGEFDIRWFREVRDAHLPNAEIPNMLPIKDGDPKYQFSTVYAGDVRASKMTLVDLQGDFPHTFVTSFTSKTHPMQYTLKTVVEDPVNDHMDRLDGVVWEHVPPPSLQLTNQNNLHLRCAAILESESKATIDELDMYRNYYYNDTGKASTGNIRSFGCGRVHKDQENYAEESGRYWYQGRRVNLRYGYKRYEVIFKVQNVSPEELGTFTCRVERAEDSTYISTWVQQGADMSPPHVELLNCDGSKIESRRDQVRVRLPETKEACLRCRAYGPPGSTMAFYRNGQQLHTTQDVHLDQHINVPDGGLMELTLIFWAPSASHNGDYECHVTNQSGNNSLAFKLRVK